MSSQSFKTKEPRLDEKERQRVRQLFAPHELSYQVLSRTYDILLLPASGDKEEEEVIPFC